MVSKVDTAFQQISMLGQSKASDEIASTEEQKGAQNPIDAAAEASRQRIEMATADSMLRSGEMSALSIENSSRNEEFSTRNSMIRDENKAVRGANTDLAADGLAQNSEIRNKLQVS